MWFQQSAKDCIDKIRVCKASHPWISILSRSIPRKCTWMESNNYMELNSATKLNNERIRELKFHYLSSTFPYVWPRPLLWTDLLIRSNWVPSKNFASLKLVQVYHQIYGPFEYLLPRHTIFTVKRNQYYKKINYMTMGSQLI